MSYPSNLRPQILLGASPSRRPESPPRPRRPSARDLSFLHSTTEDVEATEKPNEKDSAITLSRTCNDSALSKHRARRSAFVSTDLHWQNDQVVVAGTDRRQREAFDNGN